MSETHSQRVRRGRPAFIKEFTERVINNAFFFFFSLKGSKGVLGRKGIKGLKGAKVREEGGVSSIVE